MIWDWSQSDFACQGQRQRNIRRFSYGRLITWAHLFFILSFRLSFLVGKQYIAPDHISKGAVWDIIWLRNRNFDRWLAVCYFKVLDCLEMTINRNPEIGHLRVTRKILNIQEMVVKIGSMFLQQCLRSKKKD